MNDFNIYGKDIQYIEQRFPGISDVLAGKKRCMSPYEDPTNNLSQFPMFVHFSDLHGDEERLENIVDIANYLKPTALINTGDTVQFYSTDDLPDMPTVNVPYLITIGNHDSFGYTSEEAVYEKFIEPFAEANNYVLDTEVTSPTYYYVDYPAQKMRVFCLNDYQANSSTSPTVTKKMNQEQLDWFCEKLLATPEGYGIICCYHMPERPSVPPTGYEDFWTRSFSINVQKAVTDIIDAYISGTSISGTYYSTVTVNADFSGKNTETEFIAHLCGHLHCDYIGYYSGTTNTQLCLNITCANTWINRTREGGDGTDYPCYNEVSDLARIDGTTTQDAVNVYIIDRENQAVKVVRIGARLTTGFKKREHMVIPYA